MAFRSTSTRSVSSQALAGSVAAAELQSRRCKASDRVCISMFKTSMLISTIRFKCPRCGARRRSLLDAIGRRWARAVSADAHLHPSMTVQFLDVISEVLVRKHGVRVIMTTHSPSTVALAPEGAIFQMERGGAEILPVADRAAIISILTAGLVTVSRATRWRWRSSGCRAACARLSRSS